MPFINRDDFIRRLWVLGFDFTSDSDAGSAFSRSGLRIVVPRREQLEESWVEEELRRCASLPHKPGRKRGRSRPVSPCCNEESRLRSIHARVVTFACTKCGEHWDRPQKAPHLRILSS